MHIDAIADANMAVLVDYYATWCKPCLAMMPTVEAFAAAHADRVRLVKIDVSEHTDFAVAQRVMGVPTLALYTGGQERWRHAGVLSQGELEDALQAFL